MFAPYRAQVTRRAHLGALTLILVAVSAPFSSCAGDEEGAAACPSVLSFQGTDYYEAPADRDLPGTKQVGTGELPGCSDTNDAPAVSEQVEVWQLRGVDPAVAVAARLGGDLQLFVAADEEDVCGVKYTRCTGAG